MVEIVKDRVRSTWAVVAATVTLVVAVGLVGARQAIRLMLAHAHLLPRH